MYGGEQFNDNFALNFFEAGQQPFNIALLPGSGAAGQGLQVQTMPGGIGRRGGA